MMVDHEQIESLKQEAAGVPEAGAASPGPAATATPAEIKRLMRLRVPVIVRIAHRPLRVSSIRRLSLGTILEFERPVDEPLELLINNHVIGQGIAVKTGENFGLRVTRIRDRAQRIRSLGAAPSDAS